MERRFLLIRRGWGKDIPYREVTECVEPLGLTLLVFPRCLLWVELCPFLKRYTEALTPRP